MSKERKPFKETGFGKFISKASEFVPEILNVGTKIATGNISGAVKDVRLLLTKDAETNARAKDLLIEFEKYQMEYAKELYELEIQDRDSARSREVELAKTGKTDFMMYIAGFVGLGAFVLMVVSVIFGKRWNLDISNNALFHQLMGLIEGVALTIFAYYFGTSKSSKDKDDKIKNV